MSFWKELNRRKVLRVAAAYIVAAWVLLQVADTLTSVLELPVWTGKLVFVLLLVGFVPAIILAWAYDLTPDGIRVTSDVAGSGELPSGGKISAAAVLAALSLVAILIAAGYWYLGKDARWVRDVAMPALDASIDVGDFEAAFSLAREVATVSPDDEELSEIWQSFAWRTSIISGPDGATVYRREYDDTGGEWQELGVTPLHDIHIPFGASLIRIEKEGHAPLLRVLGGGMQVTVDLPAEEKPDVDFNVSPEIFKLETADTLPDDMVRVPGWDAVIDGETVEFRDFLLGRYEVTNSEFQAFVDAGGYERPDLWEHDFQLDAQSISFTDAMAKFRDSTGRPGPSTWEAGNYADGSDAHPVSGVSWYEAAAYARFVGRELPTIHHWRRAFAIATLAWQLPASNLDGKKIAAVGEYQGIGWTGTFDMAGNVREWCFNESDNHNRVILGSAWTEAHYMVEASMSAPHSMPAFDRSPTNGIRLALTNEVVAVFRRASQAVELAEGVAEITPVSDEVFAASLSDFDYDHTPMNPLAEEPVRYRHWMRQRITIDTADGTDRIPIYLYLPDGQASRYETILYWPGFASFFLDSVDQQRLGVDFAVRSGRAVAMPVLAGMYERRINPYPEWSTYRGRDLAIREVREFRRAIDYLESRPDIDPDRFSYYGHSWGGRVGAMVLAVEPRLRLGVLNQAGLNPHVHADISAVHFLPRVTVPVLQFNGLYDTDFRYESSAKPFYELIGTQEPDKKHVVEPTGHFVRPAVAMGETLDWLDRYLN